MKYLDALTAAFTIGLASYATWRLIAVDTITKRVRVWLFSEARLNKTFYAWLKLWWKCPWCAGAWITACITILADELVEGGLPAPLLVFAAARAVTGWIGSHDEDYQSQMMEGEA